MTGARLAVALAIATLFAALGFVAPASSGVSGLAKVTSPTADAAMPRLYKNCTNYNKRYPHGVGRLRARDRTRGGTPPVTTFRRSTRIYNIAMSYNRGLDRDKDGVACEKR
jgi:hypothetical protein